MNFKLTLLLVSSLLLVNVSAFSVDDDDDDPDPPGFATDKEIKEDLKDYDEDDRFDGDNVHDALSRNPDMENITSTTITKHGYPVEEYTVTTADGYILKLFRIPGGGISPPAPGKRVAFLMHGLISSSVDWIVSGPGRSLAYMLADEGYDVWMGNARGNTHSRFHIYLDPKKKAFWQFDWHHIGQIDLPTMIDFVLQQTGKQKLHYVGHSQGTTSFFVMASLRPEYNQKILSMHALAPIAFMGKMKSPFIRVIARFTNSMEWVLKMMGIYEFFPSNKLMVKGGQLVCHNESPIQFICVNVLFLICGYNSEQLDRDLLPEIMENTPAGASVDQFLHYGQEVNSNKFRLWDHGFFGNRKHYGKSSPPDYNLKNINAPVALHYGDNDWLASVKDVDKLAAGLPNLIGKFRVGHNKWNHLDFLFAIDLKYYLNDRILSLMRRYDD